MSRCNLALGMTVGIISKGGLDRTYLLGNYGAGISSRGYRRAFSLLALLSVNGKNLVKNLVKRIFFTGRASRAVLQRLRRIRVCCLSVFLNYLLSVKIYFRVTSPLPIICVVFSIYAPSIPTRFDSLGAASAPRNIQLSTYHPIRGDQRRTMLGPADCLIYMIKNSVLSANLRCS